MDKEINYDKIMSDRKLFNDFVYTPLSEALKILEERQKDPVVMSKIEELLEGNIPEVLRQSKCAVQFRQIATPNNDTLHFISITKDNNLKSVFFEYLDDKFTSNNEFKHSLGQLRIQGKVNKKGDYTFEKHTLVDFAKYDGKKIINVNTIKGERLLDFHRKMFNFYQFEYKNIEFYDGSAWLNSCGENASYYYEKFLTLFICNGILFENFLTNKEDSDFTKKIILPSLYNLVKSTKLKPLIVPIGPLDMENDIHWISYNNKIKSLL